MLCNAVLENIGFVRTVTGINRTSTYIILIYCLVYRTISPSDDFNCGLWGRDIYSPVVNRLYTIPQKIMLLLF